MTNKETQQKTNDTPDLREAVISKITNEHIQPTGKWVFFCSNCVMWTLWLTTVVIGAVAFTETLYMSMHSGIEYYEATHASVADFIVDSLPFVWIIAFLGMVVLAYRNMRMTRRGYRYPLWQIVGSSLILSILGGVLLHAAGVGKLIDNVVGDVMPTMYTSAEVRQAYMWAHPEEGRLVGVYTAHDDQHNWIRFSDSKEQEWLVATHELSAYDTKVLTSGERVRLLGVTGEATDYRTFYACAVLPWMPKDGHSLSSIRESRNELHRSLRESQRQKASSSPHAADETRLRCRVILEKIMH